MFEPLGFVLLIEHFCSFRYLRGIRTLDAEVLDDGFIIVGRITAEMAFSSSNQNSLARAHTAFYRCQIEQGITIIRGLWNLLIQHTKLKSLSLWLVTDSIPTMILALALEQLPI